MEDFKPEDIIRTTNKIDSWLRVAGIASEEELLKMVRSSMNIYIIFETELKRRFPETYKKYEKEFDE